MGGAFLGVVSFGSVSLPPRPPPPRRTHAHTHARRNETEFLSKRHQLGCSVSLEDGGKIFIPMLLGDVVFCFDLSADSDAADCKAGDRA